MARKIKRIDGNVNESVADRRQVAQTAPEAAASAKARARRKPEPVEPKSKDTKVTGRTKSASKSQPPSKDSKSDLILKTLRTSKGASIEMLMTGTGWQAHSVRGFLSAVVKKKLALNLVSDIGKDGIRRYRIDGDLKSV